MSEVHRASTLKALVSTIRSASTVAAQDVNFYKSLDKSVEVEAENCSSELLDLANILLQTVAPKEVPNLESLEDLEENWKQIENVVDGLFEKTDISLDQLKKRGAPGSGNIIDSSAREQGLQSVQTDNDKSNKEYVQSQSAARTLAKPQLQFARKIDNSGDKPFKPLLTSKPHAIVSLEESLQPQEVVDSEGVVRQCYKHPYETEINEQKFHNLSKAEPIPFKDWYQTEAVYVDNKDKLNDMIDALLKSKEIAVDLEHHDLRSYYGFVCLMQISNREKDWIVDTLALREELQALNHVFTDPNIVKVFHGAHMDIIWLQRDFGLYVVGLFDTYHAAKALELKRHGLAFLLEAYAQFYQSKKYQLADWRVRPLPEQMISYARADTHFLLYIYDLMRNELIDKNLFEDVLEDSKKVALQTYETPGYLSLTSLTPSSPAYDRLVLKYKMSPAHEIVLKQLYNWRDRVARDLDESPGYIMPNYFMVALSSQMPTDVPSVLSAASTGVTPHVRTAAKEIALIITRAKKVVDRLHEMEKESSRHKENGNENDSDMGKADAIGVEFYFVSSNYEQYMKSYNVALKHQSKLFDGKSIIRGTLGLLKTESDFFGPSGNIDDALVKDARELNERRAYVEKNLKLHESVIYEEKEDSEDSEESEESEEEGTDNETEENEKHKDDEEAMTEVEEDGGAKVAIEAEEELQLLPETHEDDLLALNSKQRRKLKRKQMAVITKENKKRKLELKKQLEQQFERFENQEKNSEPNAVAPGSQNASDVISSEASLASTSPAPSAPTDYSKAEPVLRPPVESQAQRLKNKAKHFTNSFKDTIKGAKRTPKDRALKGQRSMVFKKK